MAGEHDALEGRLALRHRLELQAEVEARPLPGQPADLPAEDLLRQPLGVLRGGDRDHGVRVHVVHVRLRDEGVQRRVDGGRAGVEVEGAVRQVPHHVVLVLEAAVEALQRLELVEVERREAVRLHGPEVPARALHPQDAHVLPAQRVLLPHLGRGVSPAEVRDAEVRAQQVRAVEQPLRLAHPRRLLIVPLVRKALRATSVVHRVSLVRANGHGNDSQSLRPGNRPYESGAFRPRGLSQRVYGCQFDAPPPEGVASPGSGLTPRETPMIRRRASSSRPSCSPSFTLGFFPALARAERATVREYRKVFRTYPFSDPDPIPNPGRIYPYFRFDGFTDRPVDKEWTVVELENRWIRVTVMPEIGGKVWTAVEKSTGKPFLYGNSVVKFRDVAMRGPWTSGGIEANYGIIGHTPNCATPVDYVLRENPDGSASVVIGVLDLLTRTPWRLEVKLEADKAYFTTTSLWHNQTPLEQPYYTWMNAGFKAAGNLQFVYPGTHEIGHGGEVGPWPVDEKGRDLSFYERNDFGGPKSYHVLGRESDFWGAFWHDDDFGMGRWSPRDEKLGKKIWIWGLSRQGMIWEKLLTDTDGQYVELQSGRSFNQAAEGSTRTPFKHRGFVPYGTDTWTEYWFPVVGTKGLVAGSPLGGLNVVVREGGVDVSLSPLEAVSEKLEVLDGDKVVFETEVQAMPLETWTRAVPVSVPRERLRVRIGHRLEWSGAPDAGALSRPLESPADFDWDSVYGLWLSGKEHLRQRAYGPARDALEACLKKDPHYVPALGDLALLRYRAMDYAGAFDLARRALAIDAYDPLGNYAYGLAAARLGRTADARDGFELAAQSVELRGASWTELARLALRGGDFERAASDAERSLDFNFRNLEGHQLLALARRLGGRKDEAAVSVDALLALDPLSTFGRFEKALAAGGEAPRAFAAGLRGERPEEVLLELAIWYHGLGRRGRGRAPPRARAAERRGPVLARTPEGASGATPARPRP